MNTTEHMTADLAELLAFTDLPWYLNRWGFPEVTFPDEEYTIRVSEDDGTFRMTVLSGGRAELIHTEMQFSGVAAQAVLLASIDAVVAELA